MTIHVGYQSRQGIPEDPGGQYSLLRAQDFDDNGNLVRSPMRFTPIERPEKYLLSNEDILLLARGRVHFAFLVDAVISNLVGSNTFYVLRVTDKKLVTSGYLAWWLNQKSAQAYFSQQQGMSTAPFISVAALSKCPVLVPPIVTQQRINDLAKLTRREKNLNSKLTEQKEILIQETCRRAVMAQSN